MRQKVLFLCVSLLLLLVQSVSASSSVSLGLSSVNPSVFTVAYKPNIYAALPIAYEVAHTDAEEIPALRKPVARISVSSATLETGQYALWSAESSELWDSTISNTEWYLNGSLVPSLPAAFDGTGDYTVGLRVQDANGTWSNLTQKVISVRLKYVYNYYLDFQPTQGYQGWNYKYKNLSNGTFGDLIFEGGFWQTPINPYVQIYRGAIHPGDGYEPVIMWKAPRSGTVDVSLLLAPSSSLSDGMSFTLYLRGVPLETFTFSAGDVESRSLNFPSISISAGDEISIHQNPVGTINSDAATLAFTMTYHR